MKGGRRSFFWLLIGTTSSGKTTTARTILKHYLPKPDHLVIVNSSSELSEFARHHVFISMAALKREWTAQQLRALIKRHGAVHFEISPGADKKDLKAFMGALGEAIMSLGRLGTKRCRVFFVVDEAANYLSKATLADGTRRIFSEGRKFGIDGMVILQQLTGESANRLDMDVRRMVSILVVHPMDEPVECARVVKTWPQLRNPAELKMPDPDKGLPGEYMIRDRYSRRALMIRRDDRTGKRYAVPLVLSGGPAPPERS